jgi:hypothetical protein
VCDPLLSELTVFMAFSCSNQNLPSSETVVMFQSNMYICLLVKSEITLVH